MYESLAKSIMFIFRVLMLFWHLYGGYFSTVLIMLPFLFKSGFCSHSLLTSFGFNFCKAYLIGFLMCSDFNVTGNIFSLAVFTFSFSSHTSISTLFPPCTMGLSLGTTCTPRDKPIVNCAL